MCSSLSSSSSYLPADCPKHLYIIWHYGPCSLCSCWPATVLVHWWACLAVVQVLLLVDSRTLSQTESPSRRLPSSKVGRVSRIPFSCRLSLLLELSLVPLWWHTALYQIPPYWYLCGSSASSMPAAAAIPLGLLPFRSWVVTHPSIFRLCGPSTCLLTSSPATLASI